MNMAGLMRARLVVKATGGGLGLFCSSIATHPLMNGKKETGAGRVCACTVSECVRRGLRGIGTRGVERG